MSRSKSVRSQAQMTLIVGTYTKKEGHVNGVADGIYVYTLNLNTGRLTYNSTFSDITNPSYLAVHPSGNYIYAVEEISDSRQSGMGTVVALAFNNKSKELSKINQVSAQGHSPCYVSIDHRGANVLVANYGGTSAMFAIIEEGAISSTHSVMQHKKQGALNHQDAPHAHMILQNKNEPSLVYALDLGVDRIFIYELNHSDHTLVDMGKKEVKLTEGAGPRQMVFHHHMNIAYVVNQLNGTIEVFDATDPINFQRLQVISTLSEDNGSECAVCADIQIHPSGNFLYASNRGKVNDMVIYKISPEDGQLTMVGHQSSLGRCPRSFVIDPSGHFYWLLIKTVIVFIRLKSIQKLGF